MNLPALPSHRQGWFICHDDIPSHIQKIDQQRRLLHPHCHVSSADLHRIHRVFDLHAGCLRIFDHCPRRILREIPVWSHAHAENTLPKCRDPYLRFSCEQLNTVAQFGHTLYIPDMLPSLRDGTRNGKQANSAQHKAPPWISEHIDLHDFVCARGFLGEGFRQRANVQRMRKLLRLPAAAVPRP